MNRKEFIQFGVASSVLAALPNGLLAQTKSNMLEYKGELRVNKETGEKYQYVFSLDRKEIMNYSKKNTNKINFRYKYYALSGATAQEGELEFRITKVTKTSEKVRTLRLKRTKKVKEEKKLPKEVLKGKKMNLKYSESSSYTHYVKILKKDGSIWATAMRSKGGSGSTGGCYITTACIKSKGLEDNGPELTSLRYLRDKHMMNEIHSKKVSDYYAKAPLLVEKLNSFENSQVIYEHIYSSMIEPCVALVNEGEFDAAIEQYKINTNALWQKYMLS